jgi:O-antigen ligase
MALQFNANGRVQKVLVVCAAVTLAALLSLPFFVGIYSPVSGSFPAEVVSVILAALLLLFSLAARPERHDFLLPEAIWPWLLLAVCLLISGLRADYVGEFEWTGYAYAWIMGLAVIIALGQMKLYVQRQTLLAICAWGLVAAAWCQVVYGAVFRMETISGFVFGDSGAGDRFPGAQFQPNLAANLLCLGILASFYLSAVRRMPWPVLVMNLVAFVFLLAATQSRMPALATLLVAGVSLLAGRGVRKRLLTLLVLCVLGYLAAGLAADGFQRGEGDATPAANSAQAVNQQRPGFFSDSRRLFEWQTSIETWWHLDNRLVGAGPGNFAEVYYQRRASSPSDPGAMITRQTGVFTHPHNLFLWSLVETGLVGALLMLAVFAWLLWRIVRYPGKDEGWWFLVAAGSVFLAHSMVEYPLWKFRFLAVFLVLLTLFLPGRKLKVDSPRLPVVVAFGFLLLVSFVGFLRASQFQELDEIVDSGDVDSLQVMQLTLLGKDSYFGGQAKLVKQSYSMMELVDSEARAGELQQLIRWQPRRVFLIDLIAAHASMGQYSRACDVAQGYGRYFKTDDRQMERRLWAYKIGVDRIDELAVCAGSN